MRILLGQNSLYYPAHGGGDKSNRLLLEGLAGLGHECRVVGRIEAVHVPISLMEPEALLADEWPDVGRFENEFVTLVNPCAVKGISIFLALADAFPDVKFAAVPTWGTNEADRAALASRANVTVLPPVDDINVLLGRTRGLLAPLLSAEARCR